MVQVGALVIGPLFGALVAWSVLGGLCLGACGLVYRGHRFMIVTPQLMTPEILQVLARPHSAGVCGVPLARAARRGGKSVNVASLHARRRRRGGARLT